MLFFLNHILSYCLLIISLSTYYPSFWLESIFLSDLSCLVNDYSLACHAVTSTYENIKWVNTAFLFLSFHICAPFRCDLNSMLSTKYQPFFTAFSHLVFPIKFFLLCASIIFRNFISIFIYFTIFRRHLPFIQKHTFTHTYI